MNTLPSTWLNHTHEISLAYKRPRFDKMQYITSSVTAFTTIIQSVDQEQLDLRERFWAMFLNNANGVLGIAEIGVGCTSSAPVSGRYLFQLGLKVNAVAVILVHNHPSGTLKISRADKAITKKLVSAGKLMDIKILDHLIITSERYISFADELLI